MPDEMILADEVETIFGTLSLLRNCSRFSAVYKGRTSSITTQQKASAYHRVGEAKRV
jgi:hypothetical protein